MSGELSIQKFLLVEKSNLSPEQQKKLVAPIDNKVTAVDMDQVDEFKNFPGTTEHNTPGYFAFSTAPFNTEDGTAKLVVDLTPAMQSIARDQIIYESIGGRNNVKIPVRDVKLDAAKIAEDNFKKAIVAIADDLEKAAQSATPELVIAVHGYSTEQTNVRRWYKKIFQYVNQEPSLKDRQNLVFIGYRWSSERVDFGLTSFLMAIKALPLLPLFLLIGGGFITFLCFIWANLAVDRWADLLPTVLLTLGSSIAAIVVSLVILRVIAYFRDNYRASNFAVLDLVELIRQLDAELRNPERGFAERRVNLNFIGHSMGGFVVTNVIRILSNVFDLKAIDKQPSSTIGEVFCLKRLVLASPDIPVLAIAASRANFLASSLRRFDEAYLFSNEGDLALRLASTAANYFSFPARTRESGYRLGNVTVLPGKEYGVVNLSNLERYCPANDPHNRIHFKSITQSDTALDFLFVSNINGGVPDSIAELARQRNLNANVDRLTIADLFTYFDCTDYIESVDDGDPAFIRFIEENQQYKRFIKTFKALSPNPQAMGVLSRALGVRPQPKLRSLSIVDHFRLIGDFLKGRDVHGGYFAAPFSQKLIYQLAFVGFHDLLTSYHADPNQALKQFDRACKTHWLQVFLSPLHYKSAYVQGDELEAIKEQLIENIESRD